MKKRVLVTCSSPRGVPYWWFASYDRSMRLDHPEYDFDFAMESGHNALNLARNIAAHAAIEQDYWKTVQLDTDMFWQPEHLIRLVSHEEDIVGVLYCKKKPGKANWVAIKKKEAMAREDGLLAADFIGTGGLCMTVAALRKMVAAFPDREFSYDDEEGNIKTMTELFPIGLVGPNTASGKIARIRQLLDEKRMDSNGYPDGIAHIIESILNTRHPSKSRLLGEDYGFSHLARKAGIPVWIDTKCIVGHVGDCVYPIGAEIKSEPNDIAITNLNLDEW